MSSSPLHTDPKNYPSQMRACRHCGVLIYGSGFTENGKQTAVFAITSSGSTVRCMAGHTITWRYFVNTPHVSQFLRTDGKETSVTQIVKSLSRHGVYISQNTPPKDLPKLTTKGLKAVRNLSSGMEPDVRPSELTMPEFLLISFLARRAKKSWPRSVTPPDHLGQVAESIRSQITHSKSSGNS